MTSNRIVPLFAASRPSIRPSAGERQGVDLGKSVQVHPVLLFALEGVIRGLG
jgi:hypothetical protein